MNKKKLLINKIKYLKVSERVRLFSNKKQTDPNKI
jgi:hypothetical protein